MKKFAAAETFVAAPATFVNCLVDLYKRKLNE
jgi:hypothetical protein